MKNLTSQTGLVLGCLLLLGASSLFAQDWPQWRGPNRDGKVTGFVAPETWPQQLTQQWKVVVGAGDATPALVGDKLYVFGRKEADEVIACLDAATGKPIWEAKYPADFIVTGPPARHPGPRSSPVVAEGRICTLGVGGILSCLDAATGKVAWRKQSTNDFMGTPYRFESSQSPIVVDGCCLVHVGGNGSGAVIAFDLKSGEPKWKWAGDAPANSSPVVMTVGGTRTVVALTAKWLVGLDAADGKLLWQTPFAAQGNHTTPVVDGQTVIIGAQGKGMAALKLEQQAGAFSVTNQWQNPQLGLRFTTPVLKDGLLYGFNKSGLFCAAAATGETRWSVDIQEKNSLAILDAGSVMLALGVKSGLIAFKPGEKEYKELARLKVADTETWAHPVVAGKRIYVRDQDSVALWTME